MKVIKELDTLQMDEEASIILMYFVIFEHFQILLNYLRVFLLCEMN